MNKTIKKPKISQSGKSLTFRNINNQKFSVHIKVLELEIQEVIMKNIDFLENAIIKFEKNELKVEYGWNFIMGEVEIMITNKKYKSAPIKDEIKKSQYKKNTLKNTEKTKEINNKVKNVKMHNDEINITENELEYNQDICSFNKEIDYESIYSNIYSNIQKYESRSNELKMKNKKIENLVNKTLKISNQQTLVKKIPASRTLNFNILKHFLTENPEDFLLGKISFLKLKVPKLLNLSKPIKNSVEKSVLEISEKYEPFVLTSSLRDYSKEEISWQEIAKKINDKMISEYGKIKRIANFAKRIQRETGNWPLNISWPIMEGKTLNKDLPVRCPLMWIPVEVEGKNNVLRIVRSGEKIRLNPYAIQKKYMENGKMFDELNLDHVDLSSVIKEFACHGIKFSNQLGELTHLKAVSSGEEIENYFGKYNRGEFTLKNIMYLENRIGNESIYQDLNKILAYSSGLSLPESDSLAFGEEEVEVDLSRNMPFDLDKTKKLAVLKSLEKNSVIWGPPGTGKSEAIMALMVELLFEQKKILMVSEKDAALSVVKERLTKYNFGVFTLKLNEVKSNKKLFYSQIKKINSFIKQKKELQPLLMERNKEVFFENVSKYNKTIIRINEIINFTDFMKVLDDIQVSGDILSKEYEFTKKESLSLYKKIKDLIFGQKKIYEEIKSLKNKIKNTEKDFCDWQKKQLNEFSDINLKFKEHNFIFLELSEKVMTNILMSKNNFEEVFKIISKNEFSYFSRKKEIKKNRKNISELIIKCSNYIENYSRKIKMQLEINIENMNSQLEGLELYLNKNFKPKYIKKLVIILSRIERHSRVNLETLFKEIDSYLLIPKNYRENINEVWKEFCESYVSEFEKCRNNYIHQISNRIKMNVNNDTTLSTQWKNLVAIASFSQRRQKMPSQIIKENFGIIKLIFPIMMGTPREVAELIPMEKNIFDYGIFDEASQMFLERSLGTLHRSKRVVISGDEKQLPPLSIFRNRSSSDEDDNADLRNEELLLNADSLLTFGKGKYDVSELKTHYRSKSNKLIEYSNKNFYDGKLQIADSPDGSSNPIEVVQIEGVWTKDNTNELEADAVLIEAKKWIENGKTVGIITFNKNQADYIEQLSDNDNILQAEKAKQDDYLFIRNIENVQGDERDVIIFSVNYAPRLERTGSIPGYYGDLSENKLNVAITRSKYKMCIVKSIMATDLGPANEGTQKYTLKNWLTWVDNNSKINIIDELKEHKNIFRSPFEEQYFDILKEKISLDYLILTNYKVSNCELDIVIYDMKVKKFVCAIELDGKQFHSTQKQLLQDFEKQRFLEEKGWKIYRRNSQTFFRNPSETVMKDIVKLGLK